MDLALNRPHRRFNALTGDWITVSPQRSLRPWQGRVEQAVSSHRASYDEQCYLCPGNRRASGVQNPPYTSTYVFDNDFPALLADAQEPSPGEPLLRAESHAGTCRVLCFSPRHDLSLADLSCGEIGGVIGLWTGQVSELQSRWRWVQVFENRGELMGCSNPHPHGQIWAGDALPNEPGKELQRQQAWFEQHRSPLLHDYAQRELALGERVVLRTGDWLAVVPWWAVWPFETLLLPLSPCQSLPALTPASQSDLASLLQQLLRGYDRLFDAPFPYSMGWHGAPGGIGEATGWTLHAHIYPPLLRSATVRKFFVGYEMLAEPQRDLTPEQAAERLRVVIG